MAVKTRGLQYMKLLITEFKTSNSLLGKIHTCHIIPEKSSTSKTNKHAASGYALFTHCSFDDIKNKHNYYRGNDSMKKFSEHLKNHAKKIINYEKKKK